MERDKALGILKTLADGIDPNTGERFPAGSPIRIRHGPRALLRHQALVNPARTGGAGDAEGPARECGTPVVG
jgi:hypothetical protein